MEEQEECPAREKGPVIASGDGGSKGSWVMAVCFAFWCVSSAVHLGRTVCFTTGRSNQEKQLARTRDERTVMYGEYENRGMPNEGRLSTWEETIEREREQAM